MTHAEALVTVDDLTRWYPENAKKVFEHFHFAMQEKDFRVIMGKSWTGKTTLVKMIIWQLIPPHGKIFYRNDDISRYTEEDLENYRKKIWIVFQDYRLFEEMSVYENIAYPLKIFGLGESIITSKVEHIINKLNLRDIMHSSVRLLSAGERQKICLARAMIHDPEWIIADEPTGNLDREHTQQVADILIEANKMGNTVLLITHDIHLVHYLQDKHVIKLDVMK